MKMKKILFLMAASITLLMTMTVLTSCTDDNDDAPVVTDDKLVVVTDDKPFPYDSDIDETVQPGDDYYRYALGKWLDSSNPSTSLSQQIRENNQALLVKTLTTSNDHLLVQLRRLVDEAMTDDSRSVALLKERLAMLEQVETADQLFEAFATLHRLGYSPLVRLVPYVGPNNGKNIINLMVTGAKTAEMDTVMGRADAKRLPEKVSSYCQTLRHFDYSEERIAQISENATKVETMEMQIFPLILNIELLNSPQFAATRGSDGDEAMNAKIKVGALMGIDEADIREERVLPMPMNCIVPFASASQQPELIPVFRDYMIYNVISQDAYCIPKLTGQTDRFTILNNLLHYNRYYKYRVLTEACGYDNIYKQQCQDILKRMRQIFIQRVEHLDWMSAATKVGACHKAEAMKFYVGYPEKWNDDMTPQCEDNCLLAAATQLRQHSVAVAKKMIGRNVDDMGWDFFATSSQFVLDNSFYMRPANSLIILPSWITRPRFDSQLSEAIIYASSICFGHELCHGFDADGSKYDADGNQRDWWEPTDRQAFDAKQQMMVDLFNQMEDYPGQPADGALTLNENLADYGGVELALECYKLRLTEQGFSGEQFDEQIKKFFLAYAQLYKDDYERSLETLKVMHDKKNTHSLHHVRINGMMRLQNDWYRLYNVKPTDKLYLAPDNRVKIW